MRPFFKKPERIQQLQQEAESWIGTPFVPFQGIKRGGSDCVHLVHQLAFVCGFPHELKPPRYTLDATSHRDDSMLDDYLAAIPGCVRMAEGTPLIAGDLVTFVMGRASHHLAMMVKPPVFIHSMRGLGTAYGQINDPTYAKRMSTAYRLMEQ